jgi:hypothetical protein
LLDRREKEMEGGGREKKGEGGGRRGKDTFQFFRYIHRFQLPGSHSITTDLANLFYSWDYANIHFVALDTESIVDTTSFTKSVSFF